MPDNRFGFIVIDRGAFHHPLLEREDWFRAFQWIITKSAYEACGERLRFGVADLKRGQIARTVRSLADEWGWSKAKVEYFLRTFQDEGMLTCSVVYRTKSRTKSRTKNAQRLTLITVCNYDKFQNLSPRRTQRAGQSTGQKAGQKSPDLFENAQTFCANQSNQSNQQQEEGLKTVVWEEEGAKRGIDKPRHTARTKDGNLIWCDHGTSEWKAYAENFKVLRGAEPIPDRRGGYWFWYHGEERRPERRQFRRRA